MIVFGQYVLQDLGMKLKLLRDSGFAAVEIGPLILEWGKKGDLPKLLSDTGMAVSAVHLGTRTLGDERRLAGICDSAADVGCTTIICSGVLGGNRTTAGYTQTGALIGTATESLASLGMQLGYHHHNWELEDNFSSRRGLDLLLSHCADTTEIVFDTYWARVAGVELDVLWRAWGHRCRMVHLKDGLLVPRAFRPLGDGKALVAEAFQFLAAHDVPAVIWEQDLAEDRSIEQCVRVSGNWLAEAVKANV